MSKINFSLTKTFDVTPCIVSQILGWFDRVRGASPRFKSYQLCYVAQASSLEREIIDGIRKEIDIPPIVAVDPEEPIEIIRKRSLRRELERKLEIQNTAFELQAFISGDFRAYENELREKWNRSLYAYYGSYSKTQANPENKADYTEIRPYSFSIINGICQRLRDQG